MSMNAAARARGQIMFLLGLVLASGVVFWVDRQESVPVSDIEPAPRWVTTPPAGAREAWSYFERNGDAHSGFVNANDRCGWTTASDVGDGLRAAIAAHRLGLISGREMYARVDAALATLATVDASRTDVRLDTKSGRAIGAAPASDAESLRTALALIAWSYPANSAAAARELRRWKTSPHATTAAPVSDAARNAGLLVDAAIRTRGEMTK